MRTVDLLAAVDAYGGDLAAWPEELASRARAAEATDPAFRAALAEVRALDVLLHQAMQVPPPPLGYSTRITTRAIEVAQTRADRFSLRWILALGSGWAVAATAAGIVSAQLLAQTDPDLYSLAEIAIGAAQYVTGN
jgi:hypothetical protein